MSYIGKTPTIGNFQVCDAISVVNGQAAYTMQVNSVNVVPESANHMLVSLNGILQKPGGSFTVSGSTITFASNLATGDVIDFITLLGNVLDLGTPSDATVTNAKTNFTSTSSAAGLQIKGDGTTDGTLQLNCSQNSHGIKLKSPAHSAGASYTLTFPTTDGNANEFLQTNGSGVMTWAEAGGGITEIDMFNLTTAKHSFTSKSATDTAYISRFASNFTKLGTGMTLVDESHFAFPSTGYYSVQLTGNFTTTTTSETRYLIARIDLSVNGGSNWTDDYATGYQNGTSATSGNDNHGAIARAIVRVSNTSNVYVRGFWLAADNSSAISVDGTSTTMLSGWTFIKLADL